MTVEPRSFDPPALKHPFHIWHGDDDGNVPVTMAQQLAARIPGSSLTIYPGEGHFIVAKHWGEILAQCAPFISAKSDPVKNEPSVT